MSITNLSILTSTTVGTPNGNYDGSSLDFNSDGVKAVGYYLGQGSLETVGIQITDFQGIITIQGTLDSEPGGPIRDARWVDLYSYDASDSTVISDYIPVTLTGNFTWLRARVTDFQAGTINFINLSY